VRCDRLSTKLVDFFLSRRLNSTELVYHWYFILTVKLIILVISVKPKTLSPLTFPISIILTCVMQNRLNNPVFCSLKNNTMSSHECFQIWSPFILHCFKLQCLLMSKLNTFVPLGSLLLNFGDIITNRLTPLMLAQKAIKQNQPLNSLPRSSKYSNPSHIGRAHLHKAFKPPSFTPPSKGTTISKYFDVDMVLSLKSSNVDNVQVYKSWFCSHSNKVFIF
jgi:hypothetical protein